MFLSHDEPRNARPRGPTIGQTARQSGKLVDGRTRAPDSGRKMPFVRRSGHHPPQQDAVLEINAGRKCCAAEEGHRRSGKAKNCTIIGFGMDTMAAARRPSPICPVLPRSRPKDPHENRQTLLASRYVMWKKRDRPSEPHRRDHRGLRTQGDGPGLQIYAGRWTNERSDPAPRSGSWHHPNKPREVERRWAMQRSSSLGDQFLRVGWRRCWWRAGSRSEFAPRGGFTRQREGRAVVVLPECLD